MKYARRSWRAVLRRLSLGMLNEKLSFISDAEWWSLRWSYYSALFAAMSLCSALLSWVMWLVVWWTLGGP